MLHENDMADWSFGSGVAQYVEQEQKERGQRKWEQNDHEQTAFQKQVGR